jgi:L-ribulose-5-phosphate 4-epimerase
VEAADWIVWQLCGTYVRNACSAGYKGMLQDGRYPSEEFLGALNPGFASFVSDKVAHRIGQLGERAGTLTAEAAAWTGLPEGIAVAVGNVDAHVTAPAAQAVEPGQMVAIMGTSTCHVMNGEGLHEVPGMCGVVDGGITEGLWGYEAGQSGVGDIFGWFVDSCVPTGYAQAAAERGMGVHEYLTELAARQQVGEHGLIALDWHSGNRSVLVDHELSGVIVGQTLLTRPEDQYRALMEATAFGTRRIVEAFNSSGVPVTELVVAGGLLKNAFLMQLYADITKLPLSTIASGPPGRWDTRTRACSSRILTWPTPTTRCTRSTCSCTTTSAAARTMSCTDSRRASARSWRDEPDMDASVAARIAALRSEVCALNQSLPRLGLVVWTAGNVSARVPGQDLLVIKPSGLEFDELTPESMVVTDFAGSVIEGDLAPSSDTGAHAVVYREMPQVGGVVHTHSTYACAWAARGQAIPCVLTMQADEFGGDIPVGPFALIGNEAIGEGVVATLSGHRSSAVIMQNHGPFTVGKDARSAVKASVMLEEVAKATHLASQLGQPTPIPQAEIDALHERYQNVYGQRSSTAP